jgi:Coenzyme PQQ synthesis protein D (PqqD)
MSLTLRRDVVATHVGDGIVLLDQRIGRYWQLNATGALVLHVLLNGSTPEQAARELSRQHPVIVERAEADVTALLQHLRSARLVNA